MRRASIVVLIGPVLGVAWPALARGASPANATPLSEMSLEQLMNVRTSPFDVTTLNDDRYRSSNAISASRFDAKIGDLPFAVQVFNEAFITDQRPVNIFDVARFAPGVTYRSNDFNEGNANLAIRGFAVGNTPSSILVLRDGFHGPPILDFTNVARVEVVKGPASFLYGQLAPGGIVNVITKSPQPHWGASARASYGSYGQYRFDADITGPAVDKLLFFRVAGSYDQDMHYWKPYSAHSFAFAPSLLARPTKRLGMSVKFERYSKREEPQVMQKPWYRPQDGVVPTPADPNRSGVEVPGLPDTWNSMGNTDFRRSDTTGLSMWADWEASDHWNFRAGYSHQDSMINALFSGNLGMANNTTLLQGRRVRRQAYAHRGNTVELHGVGDYRTSWVSARVLLGAQYVSRTFDQTAGQAPNDPSLGSDPTASPFPLWDLGNPSTWDRTPDLPLSALTEVKTNASSAFRDRAVYGGVTLGFLDERLLVLGGVRNTWTSSQFTNRMLRVSDAEIRESQLTPQYGVLFKLTSGISAFSSYAESFVPGSEILRVRNVPTRPAAPTRGYGVEAGFKFELAERRVSGTATYFDIRNENIINDIASLDPATGTMLFTNVQSGVQRSNGVELDATLTLTRGWQLYASYSYTDARIEEFSGEDARILAQDRAALDAAGAANYRNVYRFHGAPLQMSAPHLVNAWSRYDFLEGSLRGLFAAGGANLVVDQALLPDTPESASQTYVLVSGTLGYTLPLPLGRLIVDLAGKNLAGQRYRPSQSTRARPREFLMSCTLRL